MHPLSRGADRSRSKTSSWRALAVALVVAGATVLVSAAASSTMAAAQTVPTVPCVDCGPGPVGDGTRVWSYTEFVCVPQRSFIIQFGVGRYVNEPVNFSAGIAPESAATVAVSSVASNIAPAGRSSVLLPAPLTGFVKVRIVGVGARTGRVLLDKTRLIDCTCPEVTTTAPATTAPSTTASVTSVEQVTTTVASSSSTGVVTTAIVASSIGSTVPGTLPETGSTNSAPLAAGGVALLGAGIVALAFTRRRTVSLED